MGLGKQSKTLNKSQIQMVSNHLRNGRNGLRNQTIFLLSVKSGLRAKEISQLSWKEVCNSDGQVDTQINLTDRTSKGNSGRVIPLLKFSFHAWNEEWGCDVLTKICGLDLSGVQSNSKKSEIIPAISKNFVKIAEFKSVANSSKFYF